MRAAAAGLACLLAFADPPVPDRGLQELCSTIAQCSLQPRLESCTPALSQPLDDVKYDETRCAPARWVTANGSPTTSDAGQRVLRFLGRKHRVHYRVEGSLPLSPARLRYLIDDLPLAAKLITRFQERSYEAEYLDPAHTRFRGAKQDVVRGEVELVAGSAAGGRLVYYGLGTSKVAWWKLRGRVLADIAFSADPAAPGTSIYRVELMSSPETGALNRIMNLGVFKSVVQRQLREVLTDVTEAARALEAQGLKSVADWPPAERARVEALLRIP